MTGSEEGNESIKYRPLPANVTLNTAKLLPVKLPAQNTLCGQKLKLFSIAWWEVRSERVTRAVEVAGVC